MRNFENIDRYLSELGKDIYDQPEDEGHTAWATAAIDELLPKEGMSVLDVGCGGGFCKPLFQAKGCTWRGITMSSEDKEIADKNKREVDIMDMHFMTFPDESFDLLFARHSLEHSPMPLMALMEWHRVSKQYAIVILPSPDYWGYGGRNHYHVMDWHEWWSLFAFSSWKVLEYTCLTTYDKVFADHYPTKGSPQPYPLPPKDVEYWFLLKKI